MVNNEVKFKYHAAGNQFPFWQKCSVRLINMLSAKCNPSITANQAGNGWPQSSVHYLAISLDTGWQVVVIAAMTRISTLYRATRNQPIQNLNPWKPRWRHLACRQLQSFWRCI